MDKIKLCNISKHNPENMIVEVAAAKAKELVDSGLYVYEGEQLMKVVKKIKKQAKNNG